MKQVIDGKLYDTDTAALVLNWDNGQYSTDFRFREKKLYRTKKGAWFIRHNGGALTDMAVSVGNNGTGGSKSIEPVSAHDAQRFLESHDGADEALEYFSAKINEA